MRSGSERVIEASRWLRRSGVVPALLLAALVEFAAGSAAASAPPEEARAEGKTVGVASRAGEHNRRGVELYEAGQYRLALEEFLKAQALQPDSNLLFNIASCYELVGDTEMAIQRYELFLQARDGDPQGRPQAQRALDRLKAEQSKKRPALAKSGVADAPPSSAASQGGGQGGRARWLLLGGGVGLGVVGAVLYGLGADDHARLTDDPGFGAANGRLRVSQREAESLRDSGTLKKRWAAASWAVGGAALAGFAGWSLYRTGEASGVAFVPGHGGGLISLTGRF